MFKKIILSIFCIVLAVNLCGCAALLVGAGGAGTAVWLSGKLTEDADVPFEKALKASKRALGALKLETTKETTKADVAQIMAKYTDGRTIWVDVHRISPSVSRIDVRVGMKGDQEAARIILNKIKKYL